MKQCGRYVIKSRSVHRVCDYNTKAADTVASIQVFSRTNLEQTLLFTFHVENKTNSTGTKQINLSVLKCQ